MTTQICASGSPMKVSGSAGFPLEPSPIALSESVKKARRPREAKAPRCRPLRA